MTDNVGSQDAVTIERIFDAPVGLDLADVDAPGAFRGLVRASRRDNSGRQDGRTCRWHATGMHGGDHT